MNGGDAKLSPLAGEGGVRQRRTPGEGEAPLSSRLSRARELRQNMTDAEQVLWRILRDRRFARAKFRRQVPVGPYIADFLCFGARLIIEADGGQHSESRSDEVRDAWLTANGFGVLRFWNNEILKNAEGVAVAIAEALLAETPHPAPSGPPSPARGEGSLTRR